MPMRRATKEQETAAALLHLVRLRLRLRVRRRLRLRLRVRLRVRVRLRGRGRRRRRLRGEACDQLCPAPPRLGGSFMPTLVGVMHNKVTCACACACVWPKYVCMSTQ